MILPRGARRGGDVAIMSHLNYVNGSILLMTVFIALSRFAR